MNVPPQTDAAPLLTTSQEDRALHERLITQLEAAGHKVLRPFVSKDTFSLEGAAVIEDPRILMVLDFEATGKEAAKDLPVEIGFVRVEYDPATGQLGRVIERYSGFEDPGFELSEDVQRITGLDRSMLLGHQFDDEHIRQSIDATDFVIAHNASYDRVMGERRFPELADKPWGCTFREGPWEAMGIGTRSQEFLAFKIAGIHYGAHRAMADCEALLDIMVSPAHDGRPCFSHVLENSRKLTHTVWAQGAPFDKKDVLKKDGGYRWSAEEEGKIPKTWYKEGVADLGLEFAFLKDKVYGYPAPVVVDSLTAMQRHSHRFEDRLRMKLSESELQTAAPAPGATKCDQDQLAPQQNVGNDMQATASVRPASGFKFRSR